jgi:hypothetical protein
MLNLNKRLWVQQNVTRILLPIWVIWLAGAFYYFSSNDLVLFDPEDSLASASLDMSFDQDVVAYFNQRSLSTHKQVYHILDPNCHCNAISEDHRHALNQGTFNQAGYQTQSLPYRNFSNILPSSPAVVIFNDNNELVYMGPYSAGLSCNTSNSFVEAVFTQALKSDFLGAVIVHEAKGCYCQNNVSETAT